MRSDDLLAEACQVLQLWDDGYIDDQSVVIWADRSITQTNHEQLPDWLLDLSSRGPVICLAMPIEDFPPRPSLEERTRFAVWASSINLDDEGQTLELAWKLSRLYPDDYDLRQASNYCHHCLQCRCVGGPADAIQTVRELWNEFRPEWSQRAAPLQALRSSLVQKAVP